MRPVLQHRDGELRRHRLGYKAFAGVQILDFLGVEGGYADLGKFTSDFRIYNIPVSDETSIRGPFLEAV